MPSPIAPCRPANIVDKAAIAHVRTQMPDSNNVTGRGNVKAGIITQRGVAVVGGIRERTIPDGRVADAGDVAC